ncbi:hypothetical protein [Pelagicoccus mobilis]|uniref:Transmembrane protein n=1 Tax=Pelagicoccus mobilis TaxID=415221 RepID=A0A934RTF7_9BACT|nr:hypothetical protein [Pelagicoccus mobilis]MBK1877270.1 hypothetical protein [Pelagicoccus mobilis]
MVNDAKLDKGLLLILRIGAFLCFAGWTWAHLYWQGPYGAILWHDSMYELASNLGVSWEEFVGTGANDGFVQKGLSVIGWLYLACTILCLTIRKQSQLQMMGLLAGGGLLVILSYAKYLGAQQQLPMFVEHGGQMLMPVVLVLALRLGVRHRLTVAAAMAATITTFIGHGAYALGLWPTPPNFFGMITVILGVEYGTAKAILHMAGLFDIIVCLGILIPRIRRSLMLYAAIWGLLTALARPVAGMSWDLNYWGADQFLHEALLRAPHCLIPLYLFVLWKQRDEVSAKDRTQLPSLAPTGVPTTARSV